MRDQLSLYIGIARVVVREQRRIEAAIRRNGMASLREIAKRIADKKRAHDAKAVEWGQRLDEVDRSEPEAFARGDDLVAEREADLASLERDLRQLSNLPPSASSDKSAGSAGGTTGGTFPGSIEKKE